MIDRQHGKLLFACDGATCDAEFGLPDEGNFELVWSAAKRDGWKARKIVGEWMHFCPDCEP